jgi:arsenite methyltransferase
MTDVRGASPSTPVDGAVVKQCCARLYETDWVVQLLGESFHPGGLGLTEHLGRQLALGPGTRVLDAASGRGATALFLAERFGCHVVGVDYSRANVEHARAEAARRGLQGRAQFEQADAERLPLGDASVDAIVCECAFCTFPDKAAAARDFGRVLVAGGTLGLSDMTKEAHDVPDLATLTAWVACLGDARPLAGYVDIFSRAGFAEIRTERRDQALIDLVHGIQAKLLATDILSAAKGLTIPGADLPTARRMASAALEAIRRKTIGYAVITAKRVRSRIC